MSPRAAQPKAPKPKPPKPPPEPDALVRERAGRYRSGDKRFTVRQDGGQWFVTDSQQTNEFGLEMVLGPFATVALARDQMALQREHPAGAEPGAIVRPITSARRSPKPPREPARVTEKPHAKAEIKPKRAPESEPEPEPETAAPEYVPAEWHKTGDERDLVAQAVRTINDAWVSGQPELMRDALDADVIFVESGFAGRESGRDAAIAGYRDFVTQAAVGRYEESDLSIDVRGHTAIATYRWRIAYAMDGKDHDETGRDVFVFDRFGTRWKLVWRLLVPNPE